jgi:hypothetical protein
VVDEMIGMQGKGTLLKIIIWEFDPSRITS